MPIGENLTLVRRIQQLYFLEILANELQANRHAALAKAGRNACAGQTCQTGQQGVDIRRVAGDRVAGFVANLPGYRGRHRPCNHIALRRSALEILRNQASDFLCL